MKERAATAIFNLPSVMPAYRTYCIVGQGRGGTTMIARLVKMLGVPLFYTAPDGEDKDFRKVIESYHYTAKESWSSIDVEVAKEIEARNTFPVWAWKSPQSGRFLPRWYGLLRNPFWIYVIRDHLASALTEVRLNVVKDALEGLRVKCQHELYYQDFFADMHHKGFPILLVSYERARIFKGQFLLSLITFLGTQPTLSQMSKAVDHIKSVGPLQ